MSKEEIEKAKERVSNLGKSIQANCKEKSNMATSIETFLQYTQELEQENKELKKKNDQLENQIEAKEMEHKYDVNMIDEVKGEAVKLYKEIEKQNKIINEMALAIASYDIDEEICKNQVMPLCDKNSLEVTVDVCVKCLKQYFEKKVEGE